MSNFLNQDFGSEDEDDDFNPAPHEDSDAEEPRAKVSSATYRALVSTMANK
jgi:transcription elongation factor SPT5